MNPISQVINFIVYIAAQLFFVRNLVLFDTAFCFVYIGALLLLPFEISPFLLLFIGFGTGLVVDIFYDTQGMHAAACVMIMFLRTHWINLLTPRGGYENASKPNLKIMGIEWFMTYAFPLIFIHHFVLFYLETGGFSMFFFTFAKVAASSIFTFFSLMVTQYLFYPAVKKV